MKIYKLREENKTLFIDIFADIDENSDFSEIDAETFSTVVVNFNKNISINSFGIREWVQFVETLNTKHIIFKKCSHLIVHQMSTSMGFMSSNTSVESIYLPYYCDKCDKEEQLLVKIEDLIKKDQINFPEVKCEKCSGPMEFDDIPKTFLQFLRLGEED
jgi:thiol-disulfide isomerase/thioredoxin